MAKILFVEDDRAFSEMVCDWLKREHYVVDAAYEAGDAEEFLLNFSYELIILDWELPEGDGVEICRKYRARGGKTPILLMTARSEIAEKELGLDSGADDYLTKPVHLKELSTRIRALLRRSPQLDDNVMKVRDVELDPKEHTVRVAGEAVELLPKEFLLLEFLMRNQNQIYSSDELLDKVWKSDSSAGPEAVRTTLRRLRSKIDKGHKDSLIKSIYGVGYKIESDKK